jgi:hypothetical protein
MLGALPPQLMLVMAMPMSSITRLTLLELLVHFADALHDDPQHDLTRA